MSAGTADAVYVSLRLALAEMIGKDKGCPVLFDESFARLDDVRLGNMMALLSAAKRQILIFTSCDREEERLKVLGLPYRAVPLGA